MTDAHFQKLLDEVTQSFDRRDYRSATAALKQLWRLQPENPWVQLYRGRLYEVGGNLIQATETYKNLLKAVSIPKVMAQARQALARVALLEQEQRSREVALSVSSPDQQQEGILVLEAISSDIRTQASQALAQIVGIDPYSARMQLPNRGWRIYRMGPVGEMKLYGQQMKDQGIPAFWIANSKLTEPQLLLVQTIQSDGPTIELICKNPEGKTGVVSFTWLEIQQAVKGRLPIYNRVLEFDPLRREISKRSRKEEVRDYALVLDLHLKQRNCILRFCDRTYQFDQGVDFTPDIPLAQTVTRSQWNGISNWITSELQQTQIWDEFNAFNETAIEFPHLLKTIDPSFYLSGQETENSRTNPSFHLYSLLAFHR
jgi:tetratricopeptide (TPR) repeat protein